MNSDPLPADLHQSRQRAGSLRELFAIAVPMALSSGTQSLMHVVDRVLLTWESQYSVAAALPAGLLFWVCLSLPIGIVSYLNAFVAQYDGARKPERVSACIWQGVYFSIICGVLLMLPAIWSDQIFQAIGHTAEIESVALESEPNPANNDTTSGAEPAIDPKAEVWTRESAYFRWLCLGGIWALLPAALACFYSGRGQTTVVLAINASSLLVNALLDSVLIFGLGPFPKMGIAGAAIATDLSNVYATACYAILMSLHATRSSYRFWEQRRSDRELMWDLFRFGGPSGLQMFLDVAGFTAFIMIIGWIGPNELAATNIAFNLNSLAFTPVLGVGIAVSTLVGQRIGEGRPEIAARSTWKGFLLGGGIMVFCGTMYIVFPEILLAPYGLYAQSKDFEKTRSTVVILLRFVALYSFFDAMAIVFGSAIRAAGDTVFSMAVTCVCAWGLLVVPTYLTWQAYGTDRSSGGLLMWSWIWCSIYVITLGFVFMGRFMGGRWMKMSIIHAPAQAGPSLEPEIARTVA